MTVVDILGYVAAATVAVSMMLKDVARLRAINGVGALMFVAYGVLIHSFPVVVLNGFIVVADAYYLRKALMAPRHTTHMDGRERLSDTSRHMDRHAGRR